MGRKSCMFYGIIFCFVLGLCMAGLSFKSDAAETIKVGLLGPLKTPGGEGIRAATEMALEEINKRGGILGRKVEPLFSDDQFKPETGAGGYKKFAIQDKVVAVLGTASSGVALAVMDQMARYKVPFLPTGAASPSITEKVEKEYSKYRYLFRVCHSSLEMAGITTDWIINYLAKEHKFKKAALMIENAVWARPIAEIWQKNLKDAGIEIPVFEYFDVDTKDFMPILSKIISNKAEVICVLSSHVDSATYINQWASMRGPIMVGITGTGSTVWGATGGKVQSMVEMSHPATARLTPKSKPFYATYLERYKVIPEYTSYYTYDAFYILKEAIEREKSTKPEALVEALEKTDYDGVIGRWAFDKASHHSKFGPGYRQMIMTQWQQDPAKDPSYVCVIWPPNLKQCDFIFPPWYKK
jgi:branched-chain amino acid transport system substrate-binding protein